MLWLLGALTSAAAFLFGRSWTQSEKVIEQKKVIYERFLEACPTAREAYKDKSEEELQRSVEGIDRMMGVLSLYAAPSVMTACGAYFADLTAANVTLNPGSPALHPAYKKAVHSYNVMVIEMRRDILAFSAFRMHPFKPK